MSDRPPTANGGQDLVVQPGETVTLNGITSSDDQRVVSYLWNMLTVYPHAVIEVSREASESRFFLGTLEKNKYLNYY